MYYKPLLSQFHNLHQNLLIQHIVVIYQDEESQMILYLKSFYETGIPHNIPIHQFSSEKQIFK